MSTIFTVTFMTKDLQSNSVACADIGAVLGLADIFEGSKEVAGYQVHAGGVTCTSAMYKCERYTKWMTDWTAPIEARSQEYASRHEATMQ